ncbi:MAG: HAMP domain-containing histidine kinase [Clostridiales bacterium]|nr:HAMP domain-containing histidine kinase [Candidatus Blautia equi]
MQRNDIRKSMRRFAQQVILIAIGIVLLINASNLLMTWISTDLLHISNAYINSEVQFLGTLLIALIIFIILFAVSYNRRKKSLIILTEGIEKVAKGDFSTRIPVSKRDGMNQVYQDFNSMIEELEQVQVLRKDFINSFSHEFKTPIASINGFSSLMLEKELPREEQKMYLKIIEEESERLSTMTKNTILLTKLSSSELISRKEYYDLGEQLRQCSILLSKEWISKGLEFGGEFPEIRFYGNKELMQHLWINLINNAIKYTPSGGEINVTLSGQGKMVKVQVEDTGTGMDEETVKHIFDAYFQGDAAHANPGLGLGLSIAHEIVRVNDGRIEVASTPGEGTTFTVYLPNP